MTKKISYLLILFTCLIASSCTMMVKGLVKLVVKDYNDYTNTNVSNVQLLDRKGNNQSFSKLFSGKTVYLYVWENKSTTPDAHQKEYSELKDRFAKYPDVVFANLYIGSDTVANSYKLGDDVASLDFRKILEINNNAAPFIIGKDGSILAYKGPKPTDKTLVDYVLFQARNGEDGTKSAKRLIRGVSREQRFKSIELKDWYTKHFNKEPEGKLSFSVSSTK